MILLLFVAVLPSPFLELVRIDFVALAFFSAGHVVSFLFRFHFGA